MIFAMEKGRLSRRKRGVERNEGGGRLAAAEERRQAGGGRERRERREEAAYRAQIYETMHM